MFYYTAYLLVRLTTKSEENCNIFANIENNKRTNHVIKLALLPSNHERTIIGLWKDTLTECYRTFKRHRYFRKGVFRTTNQKYKIKIKKKSKKLGRPSIKINCMQIQNANVKMRPKYAKITLKLFFH